MAYKKIGDYGLIGDMHSAALVGIDGSIDWCCFPRFDSPSVFAAILDDTKGGRFQIAPGEPYQVDQSYRPHTNVLITTFTTPHGEAQLTDFMPCDATIVAGQSPHEIHRLVRCGRGELTLRAIFMPRFDYARAFTEVEVTPWGVVARSQGQTLSLAAPFPFGVGRGEAQASFTLREGQEVLFVAKYGTEAPQGPLSEGSKAKLDRTLRYWEGVARQCRYHGWWEDEVIRSFLALHLMIYAPTGAIVAAPTTSLPEGIGGTRNWDYRYAWVRDAAFTLDILFRLGHTAEASGFLRWLWDRYGAAEGHMVKPVYGITPESLLEEEVLDHLAGYRGSRPVRIGNAAAGQFQMDVFGEAILAAASYYRYGDRVRHDWWPLVERFAEAICAHWTRPDQGIWEMRSQPRHYVYSKLMAWVGLDRALSLARRLGKPAPLEQWRAIRDQIRQEILTRGWNGEKGAFVQHYESAALDASLLLLPLVGFLPATDPRVQSTVERIQKELAVDGLVYRYRPEETQDGILEPEGTFALCTFWLVGVLIMSGRLEEAHNLFRRVLGYANHLGLFSEMIDPGTGQALGNFPQAFTHIAMIHTARNLDRALSGEKATLEVGARP